MLDVVGWISSHGLMTVKAEKKAQMLEQWKVKPQCMKVHKIVKYPIFFVLSSSPPVDIKQYTEIMEHHGG